MALLVQKFGGTSVADVDAIENVADKVAKEVKAGHKVAVVVSAMSGVTNQLVDYCNAINDDFCDKEYDSVVASGEQVTSGLLALALHKRGVDARSWLGWQVPIVTDNAHRKARIVKIEVEGLKRHLEEGEVAIVAGFQGISEDTKRISTLGRGGSDTSAVALAAALGADRCDIYTDVKGVYTTDPRIVSKAKKIDKISYEEMLEMASVGAKVLQTRSVELAMKQNVPVQVLSSFGDAIGSDLMGTQVVDEDEIMEKEVVSGVTYTKEEAKITLRNLPDTPGIAAQVFGPLADDNINVDMIVQNISADNTVTDLTFTVPMTDLNQSREILQRCRAEWGEATIDYSESVVKISIVGIGMRSHAGVAKKMFSTLAEKGINIQVISTSEIKVSVLIDAEYNELALRALHSAYGLDVEEEEING